MKRSHLSTCSVLFLFVFALAAVAQKTAASKAKPLGPPASALNVITADGVLNHIKTLSSDEFEGRGPGTHGEDLSINYIADQFKNVGLEPGNTDGTYLQKVPLVGITTKQDAEMKVKTRQRSEARIRRRLRRAHRARR